MKKYMSATNKGETHCCTLKDVKSFFNDTDINLSFDFAGKKFNTRNFANGPDIEKYAKKNIKGKVLCHFITATRSSSPWLCFHTLKESEYSDNLRSRFISDCLPKLFEFYEKHLKDSSIKREEYLMLIELLNNEFIVHEFPTNRNVKDV